MSEDPETTVAERNLRRWFRRQLAQRTPEREHLEAAVAAGDVDEVRRLLARFPFTPAQRAHVEQLLDAWEVSGRGD